ncbi:MAG TPA: agmatinase [Candidatus Bathyarchaeia archaeon]|nr:agmatinase [Candidatus Bathyarchaeia archaeon]
MSYRELYSSPSAIFSGVQKPFVQAPYVILGVPFDITSTYRTGSRFAPLAIRDASLNIETYSFRSGIDIENVRLHDSGDLHVTSDVKETLRRLELVEKELVGAKKIPALIGGEHTITLGAAQAVGKNFAILDFDAHLDLRDEYMNLRISHTTFMRRINEQAKPTKIVEIGTRAVCKEELDYAKKAGISFITTQQIREEGIKKTTEKISKMLGDIKKIYLTVDMDVLDPAFAPAVQNPEPDGLCAHMFYDLLSEICDERIIAFDLVEVAPPYDNGVTSIQAARTIFEILSVLESS